MGRHNDRKIDDLISEFITSSNRVSNGYHAFVMDKIWKDEMGPVIAGYTSRITFSEGILKVYVTSAPLRKELIMGKEKLIQNLNQAIGSNVILEVQIY
jgi:hypothetical protein